MLWWALTEAKKASFIDEIFVWTEDDELAEIARECGCHVIPRSRDQLFYNGGFDSPAEWGEHRNSYIVSKCGTLGDVRVFLNCNLCLITAQILEEMFLRLMQDEKATRIYPISKVDPGLYMKNPKTNALFPIWGDPALDQQHYPDLFRRGGTGIVHAKRAGKKGGKRVIFHEVDAEFLVDVHDLEDVKLAEYYLMRRLGGKISLPTLSENVEEDDHVK
jgi:hypothetical protein